MLICISVFCFSGYKLYEIYHEANMITTENKELEQHVVKKKVLEPDWEVLKSENEEIVAWLYLPACDFSFPVVQGKDNSFYLNHTAKKEDNYRGAIFMDYRNNSDFMDGNTVVYGHSVEGGGMFTSLKNFADPSFFNENPYFYILTPEQNYKCNIYTFAKTVENSVFYSKVVQSADIEQMKLEALHYNNVNFDDNNLITLSTCDLDYGFHSVNRLVLTAVMEPYEDPIELEK